MIPPAAPRCRTSRESAGVGQASAASQTGVPVGGNGFRGGARETLRAEARVVADQDAALGLFGAHHVARDGVGDLADIFEGEIVGDDAAPAVGAKFNVAHGQEV